VGAGLRSLEWNGLLAFVRFFVFGSGGIGFVFMQTLVYYALLHPFTLHWID